MRRSEEVEMVVGEEEKILKEKQQKEEELKEETEEELDKITPIYVPAMQSLESLLKESINEIHTYTNSSEVMKRVIFAICTLFDKRRE